MNAFKKVSILKSVPGSFSGNSFFILLTKMSFSFSALIVTIFIARKLGVYQLGVFSIVMGFYAIFQVFSIMGYDAVVIREIAKDQNKGGRIVQYGIVLGIFSSAVGACLMGIAGKFLNYSPIVMKIIYTSSYVLFPSFLNLLAETVFIGLRKPRFSFYTAIIRDMAWLLLCVWWLSIGQGIVAVIKALIVSKIIGVALFIYFLQREAVLWREDFHWTGFKEIIRLIPSFLLINLLSNLLLEADIIILSKLVPLADVGLYNVAKRFLRVSFILMLSIVSSMFPVIVETVHKKQNKILSCFNELSFRIFMISIVIAVIVLILARTIITVFLGNFFILSVSYIHVLIWKIIPLSLALLWSRFLVAANQQNKDVLALTLGLPLFLGLGILFIREWGVMGMAYADILTFICLALTHLYFVNRTIFLAVEKE